MPDAGWVTLGFSIAYGAIGAYLLALELRRARARRQREDLT